MSDEPANQASLEQRLEAMEKRLQGLEEELARARADADEVLPHRGGETFAEAGSEHAELTDDAIAP